MSALVWSVESAVLGAWALIFSIYSTPFHAFVARSHSLIAAFTLLVQLVCAARDLAAVGHAASEAFLCAVTALALVYAAGVLDRSNHDRFFSMPSAGGVVPLDAAIGTAWFCAALTSAMGMALSGVKRMPAGRQRTALMFHPYGYHAWVVLPSLLMLWLYNYDGGNRDDPVNQGLRFIKKNDVTITHTLIFLIYAGIWGVFVAALLLGEGFLSMGSEWIAWRRMSARRLTAYIASATIKLIGRCGCVLIPLSAVFAARTQAQIIMAWVLTGVAGAFALDLLGWVDRLLGSGPAAASAVEDGGEESAAQSNRLLGAEFYATAAEAPFFSSHPSSSAVAHQRLYSHRHNAQPRQGYHLSSSAAQQQQHYDWTPGGGGGGAPGDDAAATAPAGAAEGQQRLQLLLPAPLPTAPPLVSHEEERIVPPMALNNNTMQTGKIFSGSNAQPMHLRQHHQPQQRDPAAVAMATNAGGRMVHTASMIGGGGASARREKMV